MASKNPQTLNKPEPLGDRRRASVQRIAVAQLASIGSTLADSVGHSSRQRLVWLGLLAMPLLFPVALPGMASMVGALCLFIAYGLCIGQPIPLPGWLAKREVSTRIRTLLESMLSRAINIIALLGRPRMLSLSNKPARMVNGFMLSAAGVSMMIPVPIITFDNVLPALAIVLLSWGLRIRDGLILLVGYLVTLVAVASVVMLWWGGAVIATETLSLMGLSFGW